MPRRNHRHREVYEPLDLTPADVHQARPMPTGYQSTTEARRARAERQRELAEQQHNARVNRGIDWSVCLVPGCGEELRKRYGIEGDHDHTISLPLCYKHLSVAYVQAKPGANDGLMVRAVTELLGLRAAKQRERETQNREEWLARHRGHIYFVRLNGLIKVGWSKDVHERLRAYGPDVEVLAIYPGSRDDETTLHRQLRPALARGREWYEDGKILADFVTKAVAEHGEPQWFDGWTRPKQVIRTRRRSA